MTVCVLGSINMDAVMTVARLPRRGETVAGSTLHLLPGGKGANQAAAAARMGAPTTMLGAVGCDAFGDEMIAFLHGVGVDTAGIKRIPDRPTGCAHVWVEENGENQIVVASGANGAIGPADVETGSSGGVCLAQLETPLPAVEAFLAAGKALGARCLLNAAPAVDVAPGLFSFADILIVNETEASRYLGLAALPDSFADIGAAARGLLSRADQAVVLTLGAQGALLIDRDGLDHSPAYPATVVDTTGAGDAFCGVLAALLDGGATLPQAMRAAAAAASIVVGRVGAGVAMPDRSEVSAILARG